MMCLLFLRYLPPSGAVTMYHRGVCAKSVTTAGLHPLFFVYSHDHLLSELLMVENVGHSNISVWSSVLLSRVEPNWVLLF